MPAKDTADVLDVSKESVDLTLDAMGTGAVAGPSLGWNSSNASSAPRSCN